MSTLEAIQARIIELSYDRHLSINRVATLSAMPPSTIKNILRGKSKSPEIKTIHQICGGLNITLRDFFDSDLFDSLDDEVR